MKKKKEKKDWTTRS